MRDTLSYRLTISTLQFYTFLIKRNLASVLLGMEIVHFCSLLPDCTTNLVLSFIEAIDYFIVPVREMLGWYFCDALVWGHMRHRVPLPCLIGETSDMF